MLFKGELALISGGLNRGILLYISSLVLNHVTHSDEDIKDHTESHSDEDIKDHTESHSDEDIKDHTESHSDEDIKHHTASWKIGWTQQEGGKHEKNCSFKLVMAC